MLVLSVDGVKSRFKSGLRVELEEMVGEPNMPSGLQGVVDYVDDAGHIHMKWDNGRTLSLIYGQNKFKVLG